MTGIWGILQPDDIPSARRLQSLGLTRAVRRFNEKAVPGMGGLWFAMPLVWSMLGISVAQHPRRPIEAANAVEALAMKLALDGVEAETDPRVRGRRNLSGAERDFESLRKPGAYVTQPFRQTCTQPLVTLGLVRGTSARFNSFVLTDDGERLLGPLDDVRKAIKSWADGGKPRSFDDFAAIAPTASLPTGIRAELHRRIYGRSADADRRKAIRDSGRELTSEILLNEHPAGFARDHLVDLRGGIAIAQLRASALDVLGAIERRISKRRDDGLKPALPLAEAGGDDEIRRKIAACVSEAERTASYIEAAGDNESLEFLKDCRRDDGLLTRLARRDRVVIVLRDDELAPGPAFGADTVSEDNAVASVSGVPELPRIANLLAITDDLSGSTARSGNGRTFR